MNHSLTQIEKNAILIFVDVLFIDRKILLKKFLG